MEDPTKPRVHEAPPLELGDGITVAAEGDMVVMREHGVIVARGTADAWRVALACTTHETWGDLARAIEAGAA